MSDDDHFPYIGYALMQRYEEHPPESERERVFVRHLRENGGFLFEAWDSMERELGAPPERKVNARRS